MKVSSAIKKHNKVFIKRNGRCIGAYAKENYKNIPKNIFEKEVIKTVKRPEYGYAELYIK